MEISNKNSFHTIEKGYQPNEHASTGSRFSSPLVVREFVMRLIDQRAQPLLSLRFVGARFLAYPIPSKSLLGFRRILSRILTGLEDNPKGAALLLLMLMTSSAFCEHQGYLLRCDLKMQEKDLEIDELKSDKSLCLNNTEKLEQDLREQTLNLQDAEERYNTCRTQQIYLITAVVGIVSVLAWMTMSLCRRKDSTIKPKERSRKKVLDSSQVEHKECNEKYQRIEQNLKEKEEQLQKLKSNTVQDLFLVITDVQQDHIDQALNLVKSKNLIAGTNGSKFKKPLLEKYETIVKQELIESARKVSDQITLFLLWATAHNSFVKFGEEELRQIRERSQHTGSMTGSAPPGYQSMPVSLMPQSIYQTFQPQSQIPQQPHHIVYTSMPSYPPPPSGYPPQQPGQYYSQQPPQQFTQVYHSQQQPGQYYPQQPPQPQYPYQQPLSNFQPPPPNATGNQQTQ